MSLRWHAVVVDCHDEGAQSRWWAEALGWEIVGEGDYGEVAVFPPHPAGTIRETGSAGRWPGLLFQGVPEGHQLHNRMYLAVAPPADGDQQAEIRRLEVMGARVIAVGEGEADAVIMEDPEGNGFSVLSPRE
jgi:hypothetical protein